MTAKTTAKAKRGAASSAKPAAGSGSAISEIRFAAFVNGPTKNPVAQAALLRALADDPLLAPTHGDVDDSKRTPFDLDELALVAGAKMGSPFLWRTRRPKYWGLVDATPQLLGRMTLHFENIDADDVPQVCEALARVVGRLQPFYAALHFKWEDADEEQLASLAGISAKALAVSKNGPPGIFAWTWFGPELTESLGLGALLGLGATPTPGGGASLPLVPKPWDVPFAELRARQLEVDANLRKKGWFGDFRANPPAKAPEWTPLHIVRKNLE